MTPIDRALKTGRKLNRNAARAGDTAWSGDVIAARMKIMADGLTDPAKVDLKELSLMTSEKVEALSESAAALGQTFGDIGQRLNANAVTEAGLASRAASAIAAASTPAAAMQAQYSYALGWWSRAAGQMLTLNTELLKGQAEALKPIHRTAVANAKRLKP